MSDTPQSPYTFTGFAYPTHNVPLAYTTPPNGQEPPFDLKTAGYYIINGTFDPTTGDITLTADAQQNAGSGNYTVKKGPDTWTNHQGQEETYANRYDAKSGSVDLLLRAQYDAGQGHLRVSKNGGTSGTTTYANTVKESGTTWLTEAFADSEHNRGTGNLVMPTSVDFSATYFTFLLDAALDRIPGNYTVEIWVNRPQPNVIQDVLDVQKQPFPDYASDPKAKKALEWIETYLGLNPRANYNNTDWKTENLYFPAAPPKEDGVDTTAYDLVLGQLRKEFQYRSDLLAHYASQRQWVGDLYAGKSFALADIAEMMTWTQSSSKEVSFDLLKITDIALSFALRANPALTMFGRVIFSLVSTALTTILAQSPGSGTLEGTRSKIEQHLTNWVDTLRKTLNTQQHTILNDWGKLNAFGTAVGRNTIFWDDSQAETLLESARESYRLQVFKQLAPVVWVLNQGFAQYYVGGDLSYQDRTGFHYQTEPYKMGHGAAWVAQIVLQSDNSKRISDELHMYIKHTLNIEDHKVFNLNVLGLPTKWYGEDIFPST
jgi:hypothetical protein